MAEESVKRKLRAILSADVQAYSRMMGEDEIGTYKTLTANLESIRSIISEHDGRVFSSPGDAIMAEFSSVVDAVQCAVKLQDKIEATNAKVSQDRKMQFRIGVNLGDVIHDNEQVYGDGVNIAARIETLAEPGEVSIARNVYNQVRSKLKFGYEYQGAYQVKNIAEPVRVYKVLTDPENAGKLIGKPKVPKRLSKKSYISIFVVLALVVAVAIWQFYPRAPEIEIAPVDKMAHSFPQKPSIAVLPFDNMSDDPKQEYFSDGISEDIITDLSKISRLIVIGRNSSFAYKGKSVNVQQIGQDLKVRYLLEGSVRKAGGQVRINAQLIEASNGHHIWADRYDGDLSDIFALQDKITRKIISALALRLSASEQKALTDKGTDNLQAYDAFLKGWQGYRLLTKAGFAEAKTHLEKAVELDPEFARAYAALAVLYWRAVQYAAPELKRGLGVTNRQELVAVKAKPQLLLKKAMKKPTALAHGLMSQYYLMRYQHDEALAEIERAVAMDPNDPELYAWMSEILWLMGKTSEAIESANMGLRLDPNNPATYLRQLGRSYLPDGNLKESLQLLERAKRINPEFSGSVACHQSIIYGIQGRNEEARTAYEIFLKSKMFPVRNLNDILYYFPYGTTIYRNPDGSNESKNQYFMVSDIGLITRFAPIE